MEENTKVVDVPCPDCGQFSQEPVERVIRNNVIPCSLCMGLIDLSADDCQAAVGEARRLAGVKSS